MHLRELIQDQPMKPLERAIWWIEYVLRHGGAKHLKSPAANITWAEYLEIEIFLILLSGLFFSFIFFKLILTDMLKIIVKILVPGNTNTKKKIR